MYLNVDNVKNAIIGNQLPVFFFDTCSILDVLNSLHLNGLSEFYVNNVIDLIKSNGKTCWLVSCQNVNEEWSDNIETVLYTMNKEIAKTDRNIRSMFGVTNLVLNTNYPLPQKISSLNISDKVKSLSENFLKSCLSLERKDAHTLKAMQRVRKLEAPARKGKLEPKDCEIVECFLELCHELRDSGFDKRVVFVTANKDDFGTSSNLKPPLNSQFNCYSAQLISSIDYILAISKGQA